MSKRFNVDGMAPGLTPAADEPKTLNMKCRSPRACDSMEVMEVRLETPRHHGQRLYRCVKCGHTISLHLGGHFDI